MEGNINVHGKLSIKRGNTWKDAACPYNMPVCGDVCPLFEEPYGYGAVPYEDWGLKICRKELMFKKLTDERSKDEQL